MNDDPAKRAEPAPDSRAPLADLKQASQDLKARIAEERRRSAMPVNGSLGDPAIDARNADGRNDLADDDDS
ncbi:MAG: hypothetical protein ABSG83_21455 [Roseiarcus sp.]|jgi:hypothetical protein